MTGNAVAGGGIALALLAGIAYALYSVAGSRIIAAGTTFRGAMGAVFSTGSIAYAGALPVNGFDNNIARLTPNVLRRFADDRPFRMPDQRPGT